MPEGVNVAVPVTPAVPLADLLAEDVPVVVGVPVELAVLLRLEPTELVCVGLAVHEAVFEGVPVATPVPLPVPELLTLDV